VQYLYRHGDDFVFMDAASYRQIVVPSTSGRRRLHAGEHSRCALLFRGVIALNPVTVELAVTDTAPAMKGATAQAQLKPAQMETGLQVMVPSYVESGERIAWTPATAVFVERVR
jgi:elongation factor P